MIINILIGLFVIGITVVIQGFGTGYWMKYLENYYYSKPKMIFLKKSVRMVIFTSFFLLLLHFLQAAIWAFIYFILPEITEFETIEKALYFSLVTFTTLGYGEITLGVSNRILAGFEAINGILLIGWSTAFMFSVVQSILKREGENDD